MTLTEERLTMRKMMFHGYYRFVFHRAHTLAYFNNVCQCPCGNVSTHAKGLWGLASHQTKADWSRQTKETHAQSTVKRVDIFLSVFLFTHWLNLTFLSATTPAQQPSLHFYCPWSTSPPIFSPISLFTFVIFLKVGRTWQRKDGVHCEWYIGFSGSNGNC